MNLEKLKENMKKLNLKLLNNELEILNYKTNDKINMIDNDNYKYYLSFGNLTVINRRNTGNIAKFFQNNPHTIHNIKNYININNINIKLITDTIEGINAKSKIIFQCLKHNDFFETSWNQIQQGASCPKCGREKVENARRNDYSYIKNEFEKHNMILISKEYINNETPLEFICKKHRNKGTQKRRYGTMMKNFQCNFCGKENTRNKVLKKHEEYIKDVEHIIKYGQYKFLTKYKDSKSKIEILCLKCNKSFKIRPDHFKNGHGCPCSTKSLGENKIENFLIDYNIKYEGQKRFENCRITKPLPFDFYLPEYNKTIEYQGQQHYKITQFGNMNYKKAKLEFDKLQMTDQIKRDYCKNNNIKLIEIPYWEFDNIEKILKKELNIN